MARINLGCRKLSETATKPSIYLRFKVLIALGLLAILIASGLGIGYKTAFGETSRNQLSTNIGGQEYLLNYQLTSGSISSVSADEASKVLILVLDAKEEGELTIELPRNIMDSSQNNIDKPFFISITEAGNDDGGSASPATEISSSPDLRTLKITFPRGSSQIQIQGTYLVPEFNSLLGILILPVMLALIIMTKGFFFQRLN